MKEKEPSICEEQNYNQIFRTHYENLTKFIYYKCGNKDQSEDIVQGVFVKLWEKCATVSFSKAKSYLYTACNNMFLNEVAHHKIVLKHQKTVTDHKDVESPDFIIEMDEFRNKLNEAINNLPEKEREVFLLSRVEKKKYREIAELMDLTVKAVERRMSKALQQLRLDLGQEFKV